MGLTPDMNAWLSCTNDKELGVLNADCYSTAEAINCFIDEGQFKVLLLLARMPAWDNLVAAGVAIPHFLQAAHTRAGDDDPGAVITNNIIICLHHVSLLQEFPHTTFFGLDYIDSTTELDQYFEWSELLNL